MKIKKIAKKVLRILIHIIKFLFNAKGNIANYINGLFDKLIKLLGDK